VERAASIPLIAVGGIDLRNVANVMQTGASGIAVIAAVMSATDPRGAAHALLRSLGTGRERK
jgi:thiamine-phosphate pyrophosphorylase